MTTLPAPLTYAVNNRSQVQPPPALRLACVLWLVLGVAAGVRTLVQPSSHTVFPVFAGGAAHWWADRPLYDDYRPVDYFRYPPAFALLVSPFAALGLRAGGILWTWFGLGVYGSGLWQFRRAALPAGWTPRREAVFLALATVGAVAGLWNAQSNALIVGLLLWGAAALVAGNWTAGALWLALAVSMKLTPLPIVLLLCAVWPRRLGARVAVVLLAIGLVPFLTRPAGAVLQQYRDFVVQQRTLSTERWPGFRDAWTIWQVAEHVYTGATGPIALKEPLDSAAYRAVQLAAAAGCLGWCLALRKAARDPRWLVLRTLGIGAAWVLLFGPAVEHPTYVFLAPFVAAAAVDDDARPAARALAGVAAALVLTGGWGALTLRFVGDVPLVLVALPAGTALFAGALALAGQPRRYFSSSRRGAPWSTTASPAPQRKGEVGAEAAEGQADPQHAERLQQSCVG